MSVKKDTEDFIRDAIICHGEKYDYSKTNYTLSKNKVNKIGRAHV